MTTAMAPLHVVNTHCTALNNPHSHGVILIFMPLLKKKVQKHLFDKNVLVISQHQN